MALADALQCLFLVYLSPATGEPMSMHVNVRASRSGV